MGDMVATAVLVVVVAAAVQHLVDQDIEEAMVETVVLDL
jgi:hypothetical protein